MEGRRGAVSLGLLLTFCHNFRCFFHLISEILKKIEKDVIKGQLISERNISLFSLLNLFMYIVFMEMISLEKLCKFFLCIYKIYNGPVTTAVHHGTVHSE